MKNILRLLFITVVLFPACQQEPIEKAIQAPSKLPAIPFNYTNYDLPVFWHLQVAFDTSGENKLSDEKATLGRVLFYDTRLSLNNTTACASCHLQRHAFADPRRFSQGHLGEFTTRNSMALSNLGFQRSYFWDGRANNLLEQVLMPIENHLEMGMEVKENLPEKLTRISYYPSLFQAAFGDETITPARISIALTQFLSSMVSGHSKFDEGFGSQFSNFTQLELMGKEVFSGKALCINCHGGLLISHTWLVTNIGLDKNSADEGAGRGRFKVPSLRNIELTAPYMHDGRFQTLEEVIDHYNEGIQPHPSLDWNLIGEGGLPKKLNLNEHEKEALVAFLKTLTDERLVKDERFSNPF